jgi:hypothetical protein
MCESDSGQPNHSGSMRMPILILNIGHTKC